AAAAAGGVSLALTEAAGGDFSAFLAFEAAVMAFVLAAYTWLWLRRRLPGAGAVAAAVVLSGAAAVVQAGGAELTLAWTFDHNGLYHLVQAAAVVVLAGGLRAGLSAAPGHPAARV
ncbi:hypothetical protein G3N55_08045, partial [Dissulfurirhabdus thermomarina]|nr:hypothetical protein [Dissulfurirhabdus thermomarina]